MEQQIQETSSKLYKTNNSLLASYIEIVAETFPVYTYEGTEIIYTFPNTEAVQLAALDFYNDGQIGVHLLYRVWKKNRANSFNFAKKYKRNAKTDTSKQEVSSNE